MSTQLTLIGDMLVVVEGDLGPPEPSSIEFDKGDAPAGSVEEAAIYGAWIIRHKPFPNDNRDIGYEVMRQMLKEGGHPWPRPDEDALAIERILAMLEAGAISEAEFVDWVRVRVAAG
jgi:prophage maintenance system killer protein